MGGGGKKGGSQYPSESTSSANPITFYRNTTGLYPSNAQVWWAFKRPPEVGTDRPPKLYLEVFDPSLRHQIYSGNTEVAKGHYIVSAFFKDRSAVSGVPGLPVETSQNARPQAIAFHAGRVFYSGVYSAGFNTHIYFSQILEKPAQAGMCYQAQDPTSEDLRDLLPSDGGMVTIPEASRIFQLWSIGPALLVFADNGVWAISGSEGIGFTASDFSISKLSGTPTISSVSFVDVDGMPIWWNRSGIHTVSFGEGGLAVQSLTDSTIKSFYQDIPDQSKQYAKGTYDPLEQKVQYLYRSTETSLDTELFTYDRILVIDTATGSFSPWDFSTDNRVEMKGIFTLEGLSLVQELVNVVVEDDVVVIDGEPVTTINEYEKILQSKIKYIVNVVPENPPLPPS